MKKYLLRLFINLKKIVYETDSDRKTPKIPVWNFGPKKCFKNSHEQKSDNYKECTTLDFSM